MAYDGFGRQSRWVFPSKTTAGVADQNDYEEYGYDPNGNRLSLRKRDGGVLHYHYDALNRLVIKQTPGHLWDVRYAYDLRGLPTRTWYTGTDWGVFNDYDGFGRATSTTTNMAGIFRTISRQFDRDGLRAQLTFPDGEKFWARRDGLGRAVEHYQRPLGSTATFMAGFAFDAASQMFRFSRRWGSASVYEYDPAGRLSVLHDGYGWGIGDTRSNFTYNPASQLTSESRTNDAYAWKGSVAVNRGYVTNGQNQYTGTTTGAAYGYDLNGNLTSSVSPQGSTAYAYDSENRLVSASGSENAGLMYDPLGRLFQVSTAAGATQFLYDGDELIAEYGPYGILLRRYVHGDKDDDPLYWYEGAGLDQPRFPHTNRQGSVVATAGLGGAQLWINTYDEFGIPGDGNKGRFGYTGQTWVPELWYYKARFYSPTLGRFLQVDPIGYDDQINLYAYVESDPVNANDPNGTATVYVHKGRIVIVQTFKNNGTRFSNDQISAQGKNFTGTTTGGQSVVTRFVPGTGRDAIKLNHNSALDSTSTDPTVLRSHMADGIGGRNAQIAPNATEESVGHEMGHGLGAGDQYKGGMDKNGTRLTADIPGAERSIMFDKLGPANQQTIDEIAAHAISDRKNTVIRCDVKMEAGC